jgi:hypothetical protein
LAAPPVILNLPFVSAAPLKFSVPVVRPDSFGVSVAPAETSASVVVIATLAAVFCRVMTSMLLTLVKSAWN